jgi:hypothetical protein
VSYRLLWVHALPLAAVIAVEAQLLSLCIAVVARVAVKFSVLSTASQAVMAVLDHGVRAVYERLPLCIHDAAAVRALDTRADCEARSAQRYYCHTQ